MSLDWMNTKLYKMLLRAGYKTIDLYKIFSVNSTQAIRIKFLNPKKWTVEEVELVTWLLRHSPSYKNITLKDVWEIIDFGKPFKDMSPKEQSIFLGKRIWKSGVKTD